MCLLLAESLQAMAASTPDQVNCILRPCLTKQISSVKQQIRTHSTLLLSLRKDVTDSRSRMNSHQSLFKEQKRRLMIQERRIALQTQKINEQEKIINDLSKKIVDYDRKFDEIMTKLPVSEKTDAEEDGMSSSRGKGRKRKVEKEEVVVPKRPRRACRK